MHSVTNPYTHDEYFINMCESRWLVRIFNQCCFAEQIPHMLFLTFQRVRLMLANVVSCSVSVLKALIALVWLFWVHMKAASLLCACWETAHWFRVEKIVSSLPGMETTRRFTWWRWDTVTSINSGLVLISYLTLKWKFTTSSEPLYKFEKC